MSCMYMYVVIHIHRTKLAFNWYRIVENHTVGSDLVVVDLGGPLHQEQCLVHNARHSAMVLILCLQYIHGVLWHLCKQSYQKEVPPVGVVCVKQGTCQTQLQTCHFLPELNKNNELSLIHLACNSNP